MPTSIILCYITLSGKFASMWPIKADVVHVTWDRDYISCSKPYKEQN